MLVITNIPGYGASSSGAEVLTSDDSQREGAPSPECVIERDPPISQRETQSRKRKRSADDSDGEDDARTPPFEPTEPRSSCESELPDDDQSYAASESESEHSKEPLASFDADDRDPNKHRKMLSLKSHQLLVTMERRRVSVRPRRAAIESLHRIYEHQEDLETQENEVQFEEKAPRLTNAKSLSNVRNTYTAGQFGFMWDVESPPVGSSIVQVFGSMAFRLGEEILLSNRGYQAHRENTKDVVPGWSGPFVITDFLPQYGAYMVNLPDSDTRPQYFDSTYLMALHSSGAQANRGLGDFDSAEDVILYKKRHGRGYRYRMCSKKGMKYWKPRMALVGTELLREWDRMHPE